MECERHNLVEGGTSPARQLQRRHHAVAVPNKEAVEPHRQLQFGHRGLRFEAHRQHQLETRGQKVRVGGGVVFQVLAALQVAAERFCVANIGPGHVSFENEELLDLTRQRISLCLPSRHRAFLVEEYNGWMRCAADACEIQRMNSKHNG